MDESFRIRYRARHANGTSGALVVEDPEGMLYLFSGGHLQMRLNPLTGWQRVSAYLSRARYTVQPVAGDDRHPLEALPAFERQAVERPEPALA